MKRREFITFMGGAAAWPLAARAQQGERMRRIGGAPARSHGRCGISDPRRSVRAGAAAIGLDHRAQCGDRHPLGNGQCRHHSQTRGGISRARAGRILAHGAPTLGPLLPATRTVPIVFPVASDPVAAGFVESLARPGGNATGFMSVEFSMSGKRLELLKEIAPSTRRVAVIRDPGVPAGIGRHQCQSLKQRPRATARGGPDRCRPSACRSCCPRAS